MLTVGQKFTYKGTHYEVKGFVERHGRSYVRIALPGRSGVVVATLPRERVEQLLAHASK
jgi:hypothetical protein